jgi:hypothetical protein
MATLKLGSTTAVTESGGTLTPGSFTGGSFTNSTLVTPTIASMANCTFPAGHVIQVKSATYNTGTVLSNNNWTDIFSLAITPSATASKIYIQFELHLTYGSNVNGNAGMKYKINSSNPNSNSDNITNGNTIWGGEIGRLDGKSTLGAGQFHGMINFTAYDHPLTESQVTYAIQFVRMNTSHSFTSYVNNNSGTSTVVLMEVAG